MNQINKFIDQSANFILNSWHRVLIAAILAVVAMSITAILLNPLEVLTFKTNEPLGAIHLVIGVIFIWTLQQTLWQIASDMLRIRLGVAWQLGLAGIVLTAMSNYGATGEIRMPLEFSLLSTIVLFFCVALDNIHFLMGNDSEETAYPLEDEPQEKAKNDLLLHEDTTHEVIYHEPRQRSYSK